MKNLLIGVGIGVALAVLMAAVFYSVLLERRMRESEAEAEVAKKEVSRQAEILEELRKRLDSMTRERDELFLRNLELEAKKSELGEALEAAKTELAKIKEALAKGEFTVKSPSKPPVQETAKTEEEKKWEEEMKRLTEIFTKALTIGEEVPEEAAKDLDLTEGQRLSLNDVLKDESGRMREALKGFLKENVKIASEEVEKMDFAKLVMSALTAITEDIQNLQKLSEDKEAAQKMMEGRFDLVEFLGKESPTVRLGYALYKQRKKTQEEMRRFLTEEQTKKVNETYLREDIYKFPPNMPLSFYGTDFSKLGR
ncbi:MAG: hypothetical protein N2234_01505 [Planctomycetota bacterium]|nr:hypothetical protein [Planctomycetota bacterium]